MLLRLVLMVLAFGISAAAAQNPAPAAPSSWPVLPSSGFISGRPATDKDVADDNAVFVLKAYGAYFGKPMDIAIPQYAYFTKRGEKPVPVIVIQAEIGKGIKLFGVRDFAGKTATARDYELQLLGTTPPR